jgi:multidrug efflux pump subunit AcrB
MGRWLEQHRRFVLGVVFAMVAGGLVSLPSLPIGLFPRTSFPRVVVSAEAGDRPADRMEIEVTRPLEEAVRAIPGVARVRSTTSRGSCEISLDFGWGLDMVSAQLQVESAIARQMPDLPTGFRFEVRRMDPTVFPVIGLSLSSKTLSAVELRRLARYDLGPRLSTIKGVARVGVLGGRVPEYQIEVDPLKLDAAGLSLDEVASAVAGSNVVQAIGRLEQDEKLYLLLSDTEFHDATEIESTILREGPSGFLRLEDIATVTRGEMPEWTRVVADGRDAVVLNVYQQPDGGDTIGISDAIDERLAAYRASVSSDLQISRWYDQSDLVRSSAVSVRDAILIGIGLAVFILFAFLRDIRVTAVVVLTVPVVLAITVLLLRLLGLTLNVMTLGGMAAAVGLVIDDAIVIVEHLVHRRQHGERLRVFDWAAEMFGPLSGSSMATIVIFAPLAFLSGVTGAFFKALSLTMACALVASYVIAGFAIPGLAAIFLREGEPPREEGAVFGPIRKRYVALLDLLLARPLWLLVGVVPLILLGALAWRGLGSGFMPAMDEGGFVLDYRAPSGTSLAETDRQLRQVEHILAEVPEIAAYSRRTGMQLGGGLTEANEGDYFIRLKPPPRRPIDEVIDSLRDRVEHEVPSLEIEFAQLMGDLIGDLTAVPQPIEVKIFGPSVGALRDLADRVVAQLSKIPGVVDLKSGIVVAGDAVEFEIDRTRAEMLGVRPDELTHLADLALTGQDVTSLLEKEQLVGVRVWTAAKDRNTLGGIERLWLRGSSGAPVRLGRVATARIAQGQPQITREDLKTMVPVTARIAGRDLGSAMSDVRATMAKLSLPDGVYVEYGGLYEQQQKSFRGLIAVLGAAVVLVFLLLLFLYERWAVPVAVLIVSGLACVSVMLGLWVTGSELDISSLMGLTMVVGISAETAIFYMTEWFACLRERDARDAFLEAGRRRLRPILMTVLAAIGALLPLALGLGQGSAMLQPLAIAIISGLLATVPGVLLLLPAMLWVLSRARSG